MPKTKAHPTDVPHVVYIRAKMVSVLNHVRLFELSTESARAYLDDIKNGVIDPSKESDEFTKRFGSERSHTWNVTMDEDLYKELKILTVNYELELYKSISLAVTRYLDKNYPEN